MNRMFRCKLFESHQIPNRAFDVRLGKRQLLSGTASQGLDMVWCQCEHHMEIMLPKRGFNDLRSAGKANRLDAPDHDSNRHKHNQTSCQPPPESSGVGP